MMADGKNLLLGCLKKKEVSQVLINNLHTSRKEINDIHGKSKW
jgi:hypothetical protein